MPSWLTVRHGETGHMTVIPDRALPGYQRRGWDVDSSESAVEAPEVVPPPEGPNPPKSTRRKPAPAQNGPESDSDFKENE